MTGPAVVLCAGEMPDPRLAPLVLSEDERHTLENWVRRRSTAQGLALRARIVLACAQGGGNPGGRGAAGRRPQDGQPVAGKIRGVAGLYLAPPTNAAVFSVDEKPQIQAYPGGDPGIRDGG